MEHLGTVKQSQFGLEMLEPRTILSASNAVLRGVCNQFPLESFEGENEELDTTDPNEFDINSKIGVSDPDGLLGASPVAITSMEMATFSKFGFTGTLEIKNSVMNTENTIDVHGNSDQIAIYSELLRLLDEQAILPTMTG